MAKSNHTDRVLPTVWKLPGYLTAGLSLLKFHLSLAIALSGLAGFLIYTPHMGPDATLLFFSLLLLAAGCGGLNNIQDRKFDAKLLRTQTRPLPSGLIQLRHAKLLSGVAIFAGLCSLATLSRHELLFWGLLALFCYNGLYTPLKRITVWAMLPGVVCGILPVYMGWRAGGGPFFSMPILFLMALLALWQLPHFWLLVLVHHHDYRRKPAPPNLLNRLGPHQLERISLVWMSSVAGVMLLLPLARLIQHPYFIAAIMSNALLLMLTMVTVYLDRADSNSRLRQFAWLNIAVFVALGVAVADRFWAAMV